MNPASLKGTYSFLEGLMVFYKKQVSIMLGSKARDFF